MVTKDEVKELVKKHWSGRAATYDESASHSPQDDGQRQAWLSVFRDLVGEPALDVLDVGCGTGTLSLIFAELGHRVVGVDLSDAMLGRAQEKAAQRGLSIDFRPGDAESLPLPDSMFDLVVERHVIWTLPDPSGAIMEWKRALRPNGRVILIEGQWKSQNSRQEYEHIHQLLPLYGGWSAADLSRFMEHEGFSDVRSVPLTDTALWGKEPSEQRYAVVAAL